MVSRHGAAVWAVLLVVAGPAAAWNRPAEVAVVEGAKCTADGTCTDAVVTGERYEHWLRIARASSHRHGEPEIASGLRAQIMEMLVGGWWIRGEASRLGVSVSPEELRRAARRQRSESFGSRREFRRWLRRTRRTRADFRYRVRTDLLTEAIARHVTAPAGDDPEEARRLMDEHVAGMRERWTEATRCAPRYRVASCGG